MCQFSLGDILCRARVGYARQQRGLRGEIGGLPALGRRTNSPTYWPKELADETWDVMLSHEVGAEAASRVSYWEQLLSSFARECLKVSPSMFTCGCSVDNGWFDQ